jgi:hypothetical protein
MKKQRIFKLVPYDEVNDIWILKEKIWWIFYSFISAGGKKELMRWIEKNDGGIV